MKLMLVNRIQNVIQKFNQTLCVVEEYHSFVRICWYNINDVKLKHGIPLVHMFSGPGVDTLTLINFLKMFLY